MKALTLSQPWATLVALGAKRVDTRSWRTGYRGPLAIHAAKALPDSVGEWFRANGHAREDLSGLGIGSAADLRRLPRGVVVATCELLRIEPAGEACRALDAREISFGDYGAGRYAWFLGDVRALAQPVAARGSLGLWEWTPAGAGQDGFANPESPSSGRRT